MKRLWRRRRERVDDARLAEHVVVAVPGRLVEETEAMFGEIMVGFDTGRDGQRVVIYGLDDDGMLLTVPAEFQEEDCDALEEAFRRLAAAARERAAEMGYELTIGGDLDEVNPANPDAGPIDPEGASIMTMHVLDPDRSGPMRTSCCRRLIEDLPATHGVTPNSALGSCPEAR